jgi:hypothetical protein
MIFHTVAIMRQITKVLQFAALQQCGKSQKSCNLLHVDGTSHHTDSNLQNCLLMK